MDWTVASLKMNAVLLVVVVGLYTGARCIATSDPDLSSQYTGCQSSGQCGLSQCCVLVQGRYPTTTCEPLRRPGQQCRPPGDRPLDLVLNYPGGTSVSVTGVHRSLCPCEEGSACSAGGVCVAGGNNRIF